jgi:hypothetical protein
LLIASGNIPRIDDQDIPTYFGKRVVNVIATAAGLITTLHLVFWIVFGNVGNQNVSIGFYGEVFQYELLFLDGYCP